jgi:hypothetical protein
MGCRAARRAGNSPPKKPINLNPEFAVAIYCGLKILAATLVSRFCSSTYL